MFYQTRVHCVLFYLFLLDPEYTVYPSLSRSSSFSSISLSRIPFLELKIIFSDPRAFRGVLRIIFCYFFNPVTHFFSKSKLQFDALFNCFLQMTTFCVNICKIQATCIIQWYTKCIWNTEYSSKYIKFDHCYIIFCQQNIRRWVKCFLYFHIGNL